MSDDRPKSSAFSVAALVGEFAAQLRGYAKDAGTACSMPNDTEQGCDALTLGVRCERCLRRLCPEHTLWHVAPKPKPYCPYCAVMLNATSFLPPEEPDR